MGYNGVMLVNGKEIAQNIQEDLKEVVATRQQPPVLTIIMVGHNPVSDTYLGMKNRFGESIGVIVEEIRFPKTISEEEIIDEIKKQATGENKGIIVQLPLPEGFDTEKVLATIPVTHDLDLLSPSAMDSYYNDTTSINPPVVGSIKEILLHHSVFVSNKNVVVVGQGQLVGVPATAWFERHGGIITVVDKDTEEANNIIAQADILVLGVGNPGMITPDMVKSGVVILDAGTSESGGAIKGDADPACAEKASLFTPVPGGIGPITIAILFKNLLQLTSGSESKE